MALKGWPSAPTSRIHDGPRVLRDAALVTQFGDVLAEPDSGGLQRVAGADPGTCSPHDETVHCELKASHGEPIVGKRMLPLGGTDAWQHPMRRIQEMRAA
jgi:hypothetical protein